MTGKFIAIEGTDGAGKGTQTKLLVEALSKTHTVSSISFPQYGKTSAAPVEAYLRGEYGDVHDVSPEQASVLFAVDRFAAGKTVREQLENGTLVITDRYVMSNMAHQGCKITDEGERQKYFAWNSELEFSIMNIPKPDVTILLHMPAEVSYELVEKKAAREYTQGKKRDIHEANLDYLKSAEQVYLNIAKSYPNTHIISCAPEGNLRTIGDIHAELMSIVQTALAK